MVSLAKMLAPPYGWLTAARKRAKAAIAAASTGDQRLVAPSWDDPEKLLPSLVV